MSQPKFITTKSGVEQVVKEIKGVSTVAIDTEFIRETTFFPKIALIQVATDKNAWLIDPTVLSKEDLEPFLGLLIDPGVLKIMHAAYADQECFFWSYQILATPILDTAIAAALCGLGDNIGLQKLTRELMGVTLPKGRARAKWLARPLSHELLTYAEHDVKYLVEIGERLKSKLAAKDRLEWAYEESRVDKEVFEETPESIAQRVGRNHHVDAHGYPILCELVRWREQKAREANLPRQWVADNEVLLALSKVRPKSVEELKTFRGLNAKEVARSGDKIIAAIRRGEQAPPVAKKTVQRHSVVPSGQAEHLVDFVRTYIAYLAAHLEIAPRFLMNVAQVEQLIYQGAKDPLDWVKAGILSPRAKDLIGPELMGILSGEKGLAVKNGQLEVLDLR
jgi:ribonuclease D